MDRIICPNCKYVMVRPIRRDCPRCNYNLQEYMLQKKNKQNKKFHQFFELHRRIKLSSSFNINSPISKKYIFERNFLYTYLSKKKRMIELFFLCHMK